MAVIDYFYANNFPSQRVSNAEKEKPEWYAQCCDYVIAMGQSCADKDNLEKKYLILNGEVPDEFYRKILNPYNANKEKYTRFPATLRNYDIMKGIIRRYVSEYIKNPHDFIVGANNPDVVMAKDAAVRKEILSILEAQLAARITQSYQQYINEGNDPKQFNPQESIDIEKFLY